MMFEETVIMVLMKEWHGVVEGSVAASKLLVYIVSSDYGLCGVMHVFPMSL